ncbi:MAG: histidine kinase [Rubritepida sp.]|nr:histidine kinase [Rubritepida sp.]
MTISRLIAVVVGATAIAVVAVGALAARIVTRSEALAIVVAEDIVTRAADVGQSLLNRHLLQAEGQLTSLGQLLAQDFLSASDPDRTSRALREMTAHSFTYRNLMLADGDGMVWASAVDLRRNHLLPIQGELLQLALQSDTATIFGPFPQPASGENMLIMVRRVMVPEGEPVQLAAAEIPTSLITSALAPMINPRQLRVRLETTEGRILAAGPGQEHLEGRTIAYPEQVVARQTGVVRSPDRQGPGDVFGTARPIFYPGLVAVAMLPSEAAMGDWPQLQRRVIAGAMVVIALVLAFSIALLIALRARQRAAVEREAANLRLASAIESLPDGFVLWDAENRLVICNSRYRSFMGVPPGVLVPGLRFDELARRWIAAGLFRNGDAPEEEQVERALETHRQPAGYVERELSDGRWLRVAKQRVVEGGVVVILSEITALHQAMSALAEARDTADRATAAKSRLLAHVSHELRTPLSGLLRLADRLAEETGLSTAQRRQATLVGATARHLLALANEVLDLAAMEAKTLTLNLASTSAAAIFEDALAMVQPLAEAKDVRLSFKPEGLPARIEADATRLRQMVLNLLANAVKFTPRGSSVRLDATALANPDMLRFEVTDQGPGVPKEDRGKLFNDFTRLAPAQAEGTGLGLSITARLTALMGGRIGCTDPRGGTGACFWVEVPFTLALEEAAAEPVRAPEGRRLRLLAVDDVPANLSVLRALLATTGFELETVTEGQAALEAVEVAARADRPFDAILMDVMMPGMDGLEATRRLRAMPGAMGRIPVIAVTASAFPDDVATCHAAGMVSHISKPVDRTQLLHALAAVISTTPSAERPEKNDLSALRPLFVTELASRVAELEASARDGLDQLGPVHAIVGTAGHLGELELVAVARATLKAIQEGSTEAQGMVRALLQELHVAFPEFALIRAA